ncbi:dTDP-4-dehydrorhamnose reductase [Paraburkholderia phenoliruptrix]|uniref:dTDP-4-dehydrorhamnose reductase n=2 Tax=Paraburkholderia phenoliruptrix TaxID=252970 RepID=K0DYT6_9BURK|nr:dTDP-4-dehydrorhamnose reductase [Paraburkholderia phenoliruptrix]AFT90110.1 dTDP-4-dehydrorhamnose reductase [Paraburkholderia phenoliruptrix BR3459a]CAB4052747.1 dTDP-4-dehydrorhamnose reductase [Paraburkholderia phenoliruptrix]
MTILVLGAGGQVGRELVLRAGHRQVVGLDRHALDITDRDAVTRALRVHDVRIVINAAAYTAVDRAESDAEGAFAVNRDAVAVLAGALARTRTPLLHLSTDYVFDGSHPAAYAPDAPGTPVGIYGKSKWAGEEAIRTRLREHVILRVSWVFGAHGNNFVKTVLRLARERRELNIVSDQFGAPTHAGAIAEVLLSLADQHVRVGRNTSLPWGTYHYTGSPVTTWHGLASATLTYAAERGMIDEIPLLRPISTEAYPLPAPRPKNSALDMGTTRALLRFEARPWKDGLIEVLDHWAAH